MATNLSNLRPAKGSKFKRKRVGRGPGSGSGKTAARGYKGAKSRSGFKFKRGFEGGQMPLHRRLPKVGFVSRSARDRAEVRLSELAKAKADVIDLAALKAANVINGRVERAKVIASGEIGVAVTLRGIAVTKGARAAIEAAGGKIEE